MKKENWNAIRILFSGNYAVFVSIYSSHITDPMYDNIKNPGVLFKLFGKLKYQVLFIILIGILLILLLKLIKYTVEKNKGV